MDWCTVCCTQHGRDGRCPGPLDATGPEREVRRFKVFTGHVEYIGIFVAPAGERLRGRIATLPRMLWCVPGRRETIKFVADREDEVVRLAAKFVLEHCEARRHRILDTDAPLHEFAKVGASTPDARPLDLRDPRVPHDVPALFGVDKADRPARTTNLSSGGLFLATRRPLPVGCEVRIVLDIRPFEIPLQGTVAWSRTEHSPERPSGMGIQLKVPPTMYTRYVRELLEKQRQTSPGSGTPT